MGNNIKSFSNSNVSNQDELIDLNFDSVRLSTLRYDLLRQVNDSLP